ncbi:MAG: DUF262 domain-containing protein [Bacteroidetes bacterium]|nr:DUF262 domain-containing protein [Bacteroidota bacterium]
MSITPRGMSIQEAYRLYRDNKLLVNRKYQRKLVWSEQEKSRLIESIIRGYPIPLILLAEKKISQGPAHYEILDGVQRFNAIFAFIENEFPFDNKYFDIKEFTRAFQLYQQGIFKIAEPDKSLLDSKQCANMLDYQLAVTIYPATSEADITEVFGRINSGGRQLSNQERRQAGIINNFSEMIKNLAAEIRGDATKEIVPLSEMPEISIDSSRENLGYGLKADEIFWCKQGILWKNQLRESEDEEMLVDIAISILLDKPFARSRENLDLIYDTNSEIYSQIETALSITSIDKLSENIKLTFSVLRETVDKYDSSQYCLRNIVTPDKRNPIKASFFTVFLAFYELLVKREESPEDINGIVKGLNGLQNKLISSAHFTRPEDREHNINLTIGLIQKYFVKKEPSALKHGPGLALDFENSIRRSKIETSRYEFKQGFLRLDNNRSYDSQLELQIVETICAIANLGSSSDGYLFIGVADDENDSKRIEALDNIKPLKISNHYVVGINREAKLINKTIEKYIEGIIGFIKKSQLTDPLKTQVLSQIDIVDYKGFDVVRIKVPSQKAISFVGEDAFFRENSSTKKASAKQLLSLTELYK